MVGSLALPSIEVLVRITFRSLEGGGRRTTGRGNRKEEKMAFNAMQNRYKQVWG